MKTTEPQRPACVVGGHGRSAGCISVGMRDHAASVRLRVQGLLCHPQGVSRFVFFILFPLLLRHVRLAERAVASPIDRNMTESRLSLACRVLTCWSQQRMGLLYQCCTPLLSLSAIMILQRTISVRCAGCWKCFLNAHGYFRMADRVGPSAT